MKKLFITLCTTLLLCLTACNSTPKTSNIQQTCVDPIVFDLGTNDEYLSIIWNDKEYIPYCSGASSQLGEYVGYYMQDDDNKISVYELKGQSKEEWLVNSLDLDVCNELMILREKNTTTIPDGLTSDYPWN